MTRGSTSFPALCFAIFSVASVLLAGAQTESVIHSFRSTSVFDGVDPTNGVVADSSGALYGVAYGGKYGAGVVYKLVPPAVQGGAWKQYILYAFMSNYDGGSDGLGPSGSIVLTKRGKIYGTTLAGGQYGVGTVYELSPPTQSGSPWTETILYSFYDLTTDPMPSGVVAGPKGELYGTTSFGGTYGVGSVFSLSPPAQPGGPWTEEVIYSFNSGDTVPQGHPVGVIAGASGALYGATSSISENNDGVVFQLIPPSGGKGAWREKVLYAFAGQQGDGAQPSGALIFDSSGALYGSTLEGGQFYAGTVYKLSPPIVRGGAWTENVLYSFSGADGGGFNPFGSLAFDDTGALYGVTQYGGIESCGDLGNGCGIAFELNAPTQGGAWTEQVLHNFAGGNDGAYPQAPLLVLGTTVYGTTLDGGTGLCQDNNGYGVGCGTVFQIMQ